jgi:anti-anti-sigma factor
LNPTPFKVDSEQAKGRNVIVVEGELDMNTAPLLERELEAAIAAPGTAVLLDLSACEFIDSTGIALIVRSWQQLEDKGGFAICGLSNQVKRVIDITGLASAIPTHASREEALSQG